MGVYFTIVDSEGRLRAARSLFGRGRIEQLTSGGKTNEIGCLPTLNPQDPQTLIGFYQYSDPVKFDGSPETYAQASGAAATRVQLPVDAVRASGPRWIPGQRAGLTSLKSADDSLQVARFDFDTQAIEYFTTGPLPHEDPQIVVAPQTGEPRFLT